MHSMRRSSLPVRVYFLAVIIFFVIVLLFLYKDEKKSENLDTIFQFSSKDIDGNIINLSDYEGKVLLITNVASKCGYTQREYTQLQKLHEIYHKYGLYILAFPSNQFGNQEPDSEPIIKDFAQQNFGVQFQMFSKVDVNGPNSDPLFKFLKEKTGNKDIKWNFEKFLIGKDGKVFKRYTTDVEPFSIEQDIKFLLGLK